jgi:transposase
VAAYLAEVAHQLHAQGYSRVTLFLDRNPTHLQAMQTAYEQLTADLPLRMRFVHFAPYSPTLNLVEYGIHWLRQRYLHQADCGQSLAEVGERLVRGVSQGIFSTEQIVNILVHIEALVENKQNSNLSP